MKRRPLCACKPAQLALPLLNRAKPGPQRLARDRARILAMMQRLRAHAASPGALA